MGRGADKIMPWVHSWIYLMTGGLKLLPKRWATFLKFYKLFRKKTARKNISREFKWDIDFLSNVCILNKLTRYIKEIFRFISSTGLMQCWYDLPGSHGLLLFPESLYRLRLLLLELFRRRVDSKHKSRRKGSFI